MQLETNKIPKDFVIIKLNGPILCTCKYNLVVQFGCV